MGAGYASPTPIRVAPGQVVTLYVTGTKTILPAESRLVKATAVPLPTTLAGFSVNVQQGNNTYPAPLFSVQQTLVCEGNRLSPDCIVTALTVQIPYEITPMNPLQESPFQIPSYLTINDNGTVSAVFLMYAIVDNIHVITTCDNRPPSPFFQPPCSGVVTHADGSLVTPQSPGRPGETVVIYALGLGQTTPAVKTGTATPTPPPTVGMPGVTLTVQFDFRPSAVPTRPYFDTLPAVYPGPVFAGLTPGQVGLYQLNVKLPEDTFPSLRLCEGTAQSNLTIDIAGLTSYDGAAICVQPQQ
jgi:uncharacterized protein (TIGR03437 family)